MFEVFVMCGTDMRSARSSMGSWFCATVLVLLAASHISNALNPFLRAAVSSLFRLDIGIR